MAEQYLEDDQQDELKKGLYAYLRDKAARRAQTGNSKSYENMQQQYKNQEDLYDAGALIGGLSEAASMVGTVGGKRAESNIIPNLNKSLYDSTQNRFKNEAAMRQMEESSHQTDLDIARYLSGLDAQKSVMDTAELQRQKLRQDLMRRKLEPRLKSKAGLPVMVDDKGTPTELPGYQYNRDAVVPKISSDAGSWVPFEGQGPEGVVLQRNTKSGQMREVPLPKGWEPKKDKEKEAASRKLSASDVVRIGEGRDAQKAMGDIEQTIANAGDISGPIEGQLRSWNPYDERAQKIEADLARAAQKVGKYLEGGVLRAEDVPKYKKMLPNITDTPAVQRHKLNTVYQMLKDKQDADLNALQAQGYDTPGLEGGDLRSRGQNGDIKQKIQSMTPEQRRMELNRLQRERAARGR